MLCKRIIPCLDVKDGRVVKGQRFVQLKDAGDPVEQAKVYNDQGADELCFLDITASVEKRSLLLEMIGQTAEEVFMPLTVGGGVRSLQDIRDLLNAGADKVAINTAAIENPALVAQAAEAYGSQCIVIAVDAKQEGSSWQVFTHGGRKPTGRDALAWIKEVAQNGAGEILLTSMDRDGMRSGYDLELTRKASEAVAIPIIASGGVGELDHLLEGFRQGLADAVLAASIFHYQEYSVQDVKRYLKDKGIPVRL